MRGKKAKALRRAIYGDLSVNPQYTQNANGTIFRDYRRRLYQLKKGRRVLVTT
jgi:hypothetical protein